MPVQINDPVLILGGSGIVGSEAARTLRRFYPDLAITIGGRDLAKAEKIAHALGHADAAVIDLSRADLGQPADRRYSAIAVFVKDETLNSLKYAQGHGIPYMSVSSGVFEVGPEVAHFIQRPTAAPILMGSQWLAGAATLPTLSFVKGFAGIDTIEIAAIFDEQDMGGPAAYADFDRLTKSAPNPLLFKDGKWAWVSGPAAAREVIGIDGTILQAQTYSPFDVLSLATTTGAKSVRFDLVFGESTSRRRGGAFSTEIIIEIAGTAPNGAAKRSRHELVHPAGQGPLTALGVAIGLESLLGLKSGKPAAPGLYFPENLIDPSYMLKRLAEIGTEIRAV